MEQKGKLVEAWVAICEKCGKELLMKFDNGTDMSRSQAKKLLTTEHGWQQSGYDKDWICNDCACELDSVW